MASDENQRICVHVVVPEMQDSGSAALFQFLCVQATPDGQQLPGQETVSVWIPQAVLESIAGVMPEVLGEMARRSQSGKH